MKKKTTLWLSTLLHLMVDYCCVMTLFSLRGFPGWGISVIFYDIMAFGLQPLFGAWIDKEKIHWAGAAGGLLTAAGALLCQIGRYFPPQGFLLQGAVVLIISAGNAVFHVGAGVEVMEGADGHLSDLGIFVSSGALGVAFGRLWQAGFGAAGLLAVLSGAWLLMLKGKKSGERKHMDFAIAADLGFYTLVGLAFLGVFIRSLGGWMAPAASGLPKTSAAVLAAAFAAGGKALGGIAADRIGPRRAGVCSLVIAAGLFMAACCGGGNTAVFLAILFFNMAMPISLGVLASGMKGSEGFAFGLTTLALLLGTMPVFFLLSYPPRLTIVPVTLLAAWCMMMTVRKGQYRPV